MISLNESCNQQTQGDAIGSCEDTISDGEGCGHCRFSSVSGLREGLWVDVATACAVVSLEETDSAFVCLAYGVVGTEAIHFDAIGTEDLHHMVGAESLIKQALDLAEHLRSLQGLCCDVCIVRLNSYAILTPIIVDYFAWSLLVCIVSRGTPVA